MFIVYILFWITSIIYAYNAFNSMSYLVGEFWAFIWTFPIPLGVITYPFWAKLLYDYSNPNIWVSYFIPIFLYLTMVLLGVGKNIFSPKQLRNIEISSGYFVKLEKDIQSTSRIKRFGAFLIDYVFLYLFINALDQGWTASINTETFSYIDVSAAGGITNSIMVLFTGWFLVFGLTPVLTRGSTIGKLIFKIRLYEINDDYLEIPDYVIILKREFIRFLFISFSTYGSFLFPKNIDVGLGFIFGIVLWLLFFATPYLLIFSKNKLTLFDSIVQTTVASRFIDFSNNLKIENYNDDYFLQTSEEE